MSDRIFHIYKITNTVTGLAYIGVTYKTVEHRWRQHWDHAKRDGSRKYFLHSALVKYGRDAFTIEKITEAYSEREAVMLERAMIASHNTMAPNGYNLSTGGEGSAGWTASPEMRKRMAAPKIGKPWSQEKRAQMAIIQASPEYRAKMRANNVKAQAARKPMTEESRAKRSAASKRQFADPAARAKASEYAKTAWEKDPTYRERISKALKGRPMSPERAARHAALYKTPEMNKIMKRISATRKKREWTHESRAALGRSISLKNSDPAVKARKCAAMQKACANESDGRKEIRRQTLAKSQSVLKHKKWAMGQYELAMSMRNPSRRAYQGESA